MQEATLLRSGIKNSHSAHCAKGLGRRQYAYGLTKKKAGPGEDVK